MSAPGLGPGREFDWIRSVLEGAPTHSPQVPVGPGDDAAVVAPDLVISADMAVEGVHFRLDWISPREAGVRAVAAALSDLAAMAARVVGILVSVGVPGGDGPAQGRELMAGARGEIERWDGILLGGDLTRSSSGLLLDVVVVGRTETPLLRAGAVPGDELWVTGTLGAAAAAVALWEAGGTPSAGLRDRFATPQPRIEPARWLVREAGARAGLDLSDGLAGDAGHLAAASRAGVELELGALPLHPELAQTDLPPGIGSLGLALHGGEDYELLVAIPPGGLPAEKVDAFMERFDLPLTRVGRVVERRGVWAVDEGGGGARPVIEGGFDHLNEEGEGP